MAKSTMPMSALAPNPNNPRKVSPSKLEMLRKSLERFGDLSGIIFNEQSGQLVGGHQRTEVAHVLGASEIVIERAYDDPTATGTTAEGYIVLNGERHAFRRVRWDDVVEKAANLAANKGAGVFDMDGVNLWLSELDNENFDLNLTMFDETERILNQTANVFDPDAEEPIDKLMGDSTDNQNKVQLGDIYRLGDHYLICANNKDFKEVFSKQLPTINLVLTDPPYGINAVSANKVGAEFALSVAKKGNYRPIVGDDAIPDVRWLLDVAPAAIIFGGNYFADQLPPSNSWLIWDKRCDSGIKNTFADCELAWSNCGGPARIHRQLWNGMIRQGEHETRVHPTQKPVALLQWCLAQAKIGPSSVVFDPFLGSGSTLLACEMAGMVCIGVELDPLYCSAIIDRWQALTKNTAERITNA